MFRASRPLLTPIRAAVAPGALGSRGTRTTALASVARPAAPFATAANRQTLPSQRISRQQPNLLLSRRFLVAYSTDERPPSSRPPVQPKIDLNREIELAKKKLERRPDEVSVDSTVRPLYETDQQLHEQPPMKETLKKDVNTIKSALDLSSVPKESYFLGLGGTIPYFITSMSTVYLGWMLRSSYPTSSPVSNTFMVTHETAQQWLQIIEPIQLGYGAVIISFLGAIHWGMEYMEKTPNPQRTRFRYAIGVLAPAIAWPTLYLPVHFALTGQFLAFSLLYLADSRAASLGWAPPWYATYRFVLTFIVGTAILISLIFRAKAADDSTNMTKRLSEGMHQRGRIEESYGDKWAKLEQEERERLQKEKAEQEKKAKEDKKKGKGSDDKDKSQGQDEGEGKDEGKEEGGEEEGKNDEKDDEKGDEKGDENDEGGDKDEGGDEKQEGKKKYADDENKNKGGKEDYSDTVGGETKGKQSLPAKKKSTPGDEKPADKQDGDKK